MDSLRALDIDRPEPVCAELSDEAIAGAVRWYRGKLKRGNKVGPGLLVSRLKDGGMEGFGTQAPPPEDWWRTWKGRERWLEQHLPDADPIYAETAIISLTQLKREPTEELVRSLALLAQQQQEAYDAECRKAVKAQTYHALKERELGDRREGEAG